MEKTAQEWEKAKSEFKDWYFENEKVFSVTKDVYQSLVMALLFDRNGILNPTIEGRIKNRNSCIAKFERKYLRDYDSEISLDNVRAKITDLIGLRIICSYEDEIPKIEKILCDNFEVIGKTDKTKELKEKRIFGYKGLHLDIKLSEERLRLAEYEKVANFQVEIQIRTIIQHAWSSLDHKIIYKRDSSPELTRSVERLAALFEIADSEFIRLRQETEKQENISEEKIKTTEQKLSDNTTSEDEIIPIDFITFNKFLNMKFNANFYTATTSAFLDEIFRSDSDFSLTELTKAYDEKNEIVTEYKSSSIVVLYMNPLTFLRHTLYAYNKERYEKLLTDLQKHNFDAFLDRGR